MQAPKDIASSKVCSELFLHRRDRRLMTVVLRKRMEPKKLLALSSRWTMTGAPLQPSQPTVGFSGCHSAHRLIVFRMSFAVYR